MADRTSSWPLRTAVAVAAAAVLAAAMSSPPLELGRHVELFRRSLTPRQAGPPDSLTPYDPDGCLANATFSWSEGDCGLVERYLSAGAVPLFRRNRLAMAGGRQDADGHSCAVEYWEPGRAGSCCGYSPRAVENMALHPEIRIDCDGEGRVTGISWGIREGQLANYEWLYLPSLEYLRIFGRRAAGAPRPQAVNGPFPAWVHRHVNLKYLFVEDTSMDGEIKDLSDLYNLETLHINNNLFTGSIPVLPANLHALSLVNNNFGGVISSDSFPRSLQYCALTNNSAALCYIGDDLRCGPVDELAATTGRPYGVQSCEAASSAAAAAATSVPAVSASTKAAATTQAVQAPTQAPAAPVAAPAGTTTSTSSAADAVTFTFTVLAALVFTLFYFSV